MFVCVVLICHGGGWGGPQPSNLPRRLSAHLFFYLSHHLGFTFFCLKLPSAAAAAAAATVSAWEIGHSLIGSASC